MRNHSGNMGNQGGNVGNHSRNVGNQGGNVGNQGGNTGIQILELYFTRLFLDKISLVMFLKLRKRYSQGTPLSNCF